MLVPISEIAVSDERREVLPEDVQALANSISAVGLLNPITIDGANNLIAGLHRLEAVKLLGWTEIECSVTSLEGLMADLAEVDEDFIRKGLSQVDYGELLLRRKEIYESIHPETKNGGDRKSEKIRMQNLQSDSADSFVQDTAKKLGVAPRTVAAQVQTAKNLTPEAKEIIRNAGEKINKTNTLKLSRLAPEQQVEAANQLAAGTIRSVDEYQLSPPTVPYSAGGRQFATIEESIADLKNPNKDCRYTPDLLLSDMDSFIEKFHKEIAWYKDPFCTVVFPDISPVQLDYLKMRFGTISNAVHDLLKEIKRSMKK